MAELFDNAMKEFTRLATAEGLTVSPLENRPIFGDVFTISGYDKKPLPSDDNVALLRKPGRITEEVKYLAAMFDDEETDTVCLVADVTLRGLFQSAGISVKAFDERYPGMNFDEWKPTGPAGW